MVSPISRRQVLSLALSTFSFGIITGSIPSPVKASKTLTRLNFDLNAPPFQIHDLNGKLHQTKDFQGKVLLVSFWASWCPPCRNELPSLARLSRSLPTDKFAALAVNLGDRPASINNFLSKIDHQGLLVLHAKNKNIMSEWHVQGLPSSFLINPNGQIKYAVLGDIEWDNNEIKNTILALASE